MQSDQSAARASTKPETAKTQLLLGVDTCGPLGSVALGRLNGDQFELMEQIELEGRSFSAKLISSVSDLLTRAGAKVRDLGAIIAVNGPGSFTGVRVGLSAVKGLAEAAAIPVIAVSRLEVLAWKASTPFAALDAHRREVFLRWETGDDPAQEILAGETKLSSMSPIDQRIAVCDEAAAALLASIWPSAQLVSTAAPTASDALQLWWPRVEAREFVDLALLDGHYLRRSDAEIFGDNTKARGA